MSANPSNSLFNSMGYGSTGKAGGVTIVPNPEETKRKAREQEAKYKEYDRVSGGNPFVNSDKVGAVNGLGDGIAAAIMEKTKPADQKKSS